MKKVCSKCHVERELTEFNRQPVGRWHASPLRGVCRYCQKPRGYTPRLSRHQRQKDAIRASQYIRDAVRRGILSKPSTCQACGKSVPSSKLCGHHNNGYHNKNDVTWLCYSCHALIHVVR